MEKLFFIIGEENVRLWEDKDPMVCDEININNVHKKEFKDKDQKQCFIDALNIMGSECGFENYTILDEDEYKFLAE